MGKTDLERRYPWARFVLSPDSIVPHRVPFPLARRFHQICLTFLAEAYDGAELHPGEYQALACIDDFPGMDQRRIAELIGTDRTSVSQMIERLVARGLIDQRINGEDRRARQIHITPHGKQLRSSLRPKLLAEQDRMLAPLSPAERRTLMDLLVRVIEANEAHARPGATRRSPAKSSGTPRKGDRYDKVAATSRTRTRSRIPAG